MQEMKEKKRKEHESCELSLKRFFAVFLGQARSDRTRANVAPNKTRSKIREGVTRYLDRYNNDLEILQTKPV